MTRRASATGEVRARPEAVRIWCGVAAIAVLAALVTTALVLPNSSDGVHFNGGDQVGIAGLGVLIAIGLWAPTRPRLIADGTGVRVRGMFGGYRAVPWEIVRSVEFRPKWRWARLVLPADETISLYAVQRVDGSRAAATMRQLRALHEAATAAPKDASE